MRSTSDSEPTKLPKKERKVLSSNLTKIIFLFDILGIVAAVKGSYGFIKRDKSRIDRKNQESRIFFHSSEILDANSKLGRRRIKMGNEVSPDGQQSAMVRTVRRPDRTEVNEFSGRVYSLARPNSKN